MSITYPASVCVCNLRYPAHNAHAPYCQLWLIRLYSISQHNLIKGAICLKNVVEQKMCVLIFPTTFV